MHSTERKSEIQVIEIKLYPRQIYVNLNSTPQNKFLKKSSNEQLNLAMLLLYVFRYSFILLYFWALFIYLFILVLCALILKVWIESLCCSLNFFHPLFGLWTIFFYALYHSCGELDSPFSLMLKHQSLFDNLAMTNKFN